MKNKKSMARLIIIVSCVTIFIITSCSNSSEQVATPVNKAFAIAAPAYSDLAAKALTLFASLDIDTWASMLSDDVEYYFPDGDAGTRTVLKGKKKVTDFWKNWKATSGIQSMTYTNHVDIPVNSQDKLAYSGLTGVLVISYFSNKLVYNNATIDLRMNFVAHFNEDSLIDRYYTYYDRTKIVQATKTNILDTKKN